MHVGNASSATDFFCAEFGTKITAWFDCGHHYAWNSNYALPFKKRAAFSFHFHGNLCICQWHVAGHVCMVHLSVCPNEFKNNKDEKKKLKITKKKWIIYMG